MKPRIAIWAAVSTPEQATVDKDSLPGQIRDGKKWAEQHGEVVAVYKIPGHSRKYIHFRDAAHDMPEYARLEQDCQRRAFDVLWCRERSRLGRTDALISTVEAVVLDSGAEVYSAAMPHQIGNATETSVIFTSAVERAMAQTENIQRVARTSGAHRARAKRGLHSCNWPHGYRAVRDTITGRITGGEAVSGEIEAVQLATDLFLDGYSYTKIVQELNASPWRPRRAKQWSWSVVRGMMNNDFYAGIIVYGRKSDELVYSLPSEARFPILWDDDTYRAILQEREHRKSKLGGSNPKSPLSGAVICGGCGWAMTIRTYRTGTRAFHCGKHKWAYVTGETCHTNTIRESILIAAVEATLRALSEPGALDYALSHGGSADRATLELEKTQLERQAATIERKQIDLARKAIDGVVSDNAARIVTQELERELMHARERLQSIAKRLATMPTTDERRARLAHIIGSTDWLLSEPVDTVRAKLRRAGVWIVVAEHEIKQVYVGQMEKPLTDGL